MQKIVAMALLALCLFPLSGVSAGQEDIVRIIDTQDVNSQHYEGAFFYATPSKESDPLFRLITGVEVRVIEPSSNGMTRISFDGMDGYVQNENLHYGEWTDEYRYPYGGASGVIRPDQLENQVVVYAEPVDSSESLATYGLHTYVKVIGIGRDWHYIQAYEWYDVDKRISIPIDDAPKGFVHSQNVTEYANFGGVVLDAYPERGTVCLYARPDENAELIGTYYSGAYGIRLFPVESTLAYTLIRIGDTVGYALTGMTTNGNYLFGSEPPPLPTGVLKTSASLLCEPDGQSESLVSLESGQEVTLYGFHRGWYHVLAIDAQSNRVLGYVSMDVVDVSP